MSAFETSPDGTVQIHAWRADDGHWSASFDVHPEVSFGADTALVAAKRLVRAAEGLDESTLRIAFGCDDDRIAAFIVLPAGRGAECPECGGSGHYVGLATIEPCRACGGSGRRG